LDKGVERLDLHDASMVVCLDHEYVDALMLTDVVDAREVCSRTSYAGSVKPSCDSRVCTFAALKNDVNTRAGVRCRSAE
jgi:hypothetical protein